MASPKKVYRRVHASFAEHGCKGGVVLVPVVERPDIEREEVRVVIGAGQLPCTGTVGAVTRAAIPKLAGVPEADVTVQRQIQVVAHLHLGMGWRRQYRERQEASRVSPFKEFPPLPIHLSHPD